MNILFIYTQEIREGFRHIDILKVRRGTKMGLGYLIIW